MANDVKPKSQEEIEKELSVGNFAGTQAKTIGFQIGGIALGLGAAFAANRLKLGKWVGGKIAKGKNGSQLDAETAEAATGLGNQIVYGAGALAGMITGGLASMYEHWVKVERERLNIQEANKDIAAIMEKRVEFENTLGKQHEVIQGMLKKQEQLEKGFTGKEAGRREERATTERAPG